MVTMARILQITPHAVFPPRGGRRAFFFLRELARYHEVFAIIPQSHSSLRGVKEGYAFPSSVQVLSPLESPAPKTMFHRLPARIGPGLHYRWLRRSWRGPASSVVLDMYHLMGKVLSENKIDVVIFDHVYTLGAATVARRYSPHSVLMLNAHNVDSILAAQLLEADQSVADRARRLKDNRQVLWTETHLSRFVDAFWACSDVDCRKLEEMNGGRIAGYSVANGIDTELLPFDANPAKGRSMRLLFCGALNYPPNRNGLHWFQKEVWPILCQKEPAARLVVVGYGVGPEDFAELRLDPRVDFAGEVASVIPSYRETAVSIVPLLEGSGTRVKILEAMSLGSPVVSTTIGAEGIKARHEEHLLLADAPEAFAEAVLRLLSDHAFYEQVRSSARLLVENKYDWKVVGLEIDRVIKELVTHNERKDAWPRGHGG